MKNITLAVFDMAGTTVNEDNLVYKTICKVIQNQGYQVSLDQTLEFGAGKEKLLAITDILKNCTEETEIENAAKFIFKNFQKHLEDAYNTAGIFAFDGVEQLFATFRQNNIKVVLNTGYDAKTAHKLLEKLNWKIGGMIDGLITSDDVEQGRPSPEMIHLAMREFNITDPKQVLKVGDSAIDILEGKNAHCGLVIGVLSGAQNKKQLAKASPDYIVDSVVDITSFVLG